MNFHLIGSLGVDFIARGIADVQCILYIASHAQQFTSQIKSRIDYLLQTIIFH